MKPTILRFESVEQVIKSAIAVVLCLALILLGDTAVLATALQTQDAATDAKLSNDQLDSLVAPIALYPDPLLSQILVASTYPLEIVQLSQWMQKNSKMDKDKMIEEVKKQDWDPSVQGLVVFPDLVKNLTENIKTTNDIGNAFLAQQNDVMDAVQRMRAKAKDKGNLKTTEQQKVETKVVENKQVIVIEPSSPDVVYIPSYDPVVVYGAAPYYPYPSYYYPPAGYYAAGMALSFGVGMMVGAAWGGGWGYGCGWGSNNNVYVNHNNNFVNNSNRQNFQGGNRNQARPKGGQSNWQHNPQHRGGTPYSNKATANKYGGSARGDSMANRQASARQNQSQFGNRQQAGVSDRSSMGNRSGDRGASAGTMDRGGSRSGGGGDRVGNRSTSSGSRGSSAFGGSGSSRSSSMASSSRGGSSMGSRGGGGGGMRSGGGGGRRR